MALRACLAAVSPRILKNLIPLYSISRNDACVTICDAPTHRTWLIRVWCSWHGSKWARYSSAITTTSTATTCDCGLGYDTTPSAILTSNAHSNRVTPHCDHQQTTGQVATKRAEGGLWSTRRKDPNNGPSQFILGSVFPPFPPPCTLGLTVLSPPTAPKYRPW